MKTALSALARRTAEPPISWLMATKLAHPKLISLAAGFTDNPSLPVRETRDSINDLLRSPVTGQATLQYGTTAGELKLREWTAAHLQKLDGISAPKIYSADRVLITHGSQQMLYMTTEALCDAGDIVIVEDPTYFVYLGIVQSHGLCARGVRMTADGLDLAHLEQVLESLKRRGELPRLKLLYLVTYYQNPTGITTSYAKKVAALKLLKKYERAAGHPIYLLEDAAYRELNFGNVAAVYDRRGGEQEVRRSQTAATVEKTALAARGFADRVIYAGTYSKPFATGLRVGFGILPEPVEALLDAALVSELTVVDGTGRPVTYPLIPLYDGRRIYMTSAVLFSRKLRHIKANPKVSVSLTDPVAIPVEPFARATIQGDARIVEDDLHAGWETLLPLWRAKEPVIDSFVKMRFGIPLFFERSIIEITPRRVLLWPGADAAEEPQVFELEEAGR